MTVVTPRPRKTWDIALSIVLLVLNGGAFVTGAFFMVFVLAFTDYCPATCDIDRGTTGVFTIAVVLLAIGLLATVAVVVLLVRRFRAWWVAALALVLTIAGWIVAFAFYLDAVS